MKLLYKIVLLLVALLPFFVIFGIVFGLILYVYQSIQQDGIFFFTNWLSSMGFGDKKITKVIFILTFILIVGNFVIRFIKLLPNILNGITALIFNKYSNKRKLLKQYFFLIKRYGKTGNIKNIFKSYAFLLRYIFVKGFHIPNENLALFKAPFEHRNTVQGFNHLCMQHIGKDNYIKDVNFKTSYFICHIHKANLTSQSLVKKIEEKRDEITRFFAKKNFKANMKVRAKGKDEVIIEIYNESILWGKQGLNLQTLKLKKGELLAGFFPQIQKGVSNKDYILKTSEIVHNFVAGATRSGKDVFMRNIFVSCLYQIKHFSNIELHFFDTKGNDGVFLNNLKSYGVHRYTKLENYAEILEKLVKEMRKTQEKIGAYSNYLDYNKQSNQEKIKEKFIVINEFLSLTKRITERKELDRLLGYLVSLTSEGAGAGYKVFFLTQTIRRDSNTKISEILVNVKTKFALKVNNLEESFILSRGLSESEKARVNTITQHNCIHIEDNEIRQEFKAYYFSQQELIDWIDTNFEKENEFEKEKINDYLDFARKNKDISKNTAMNNFGLAIKDWEELIEFLEKNNEIERLANNKIVFKEK